MLDIIMWRCVLTLGLASLFSAAAYAQTSPESPVAGADNKPAIKRVVEPVPNQKAATANNIHRVVAAKTPSGFEVPRYVSLKYSKTNGRSGPSLEHSVLWQYRKRGLPVIVVAETEQWRKIRDINGDEAWVYLSGLSGERHVIAQSQTDIVRRPKADAPLIAIAQKDALLKMEGCEDGWCRVVANGGLKGWARRDKLWGAAPLF